MLRLQRAIHTSSPALQQAAREEITAYLQYFKTPKDLRPLVYRKRNASELLSRDLWDATAKKRIVPLEPPQLPSKHALNSLFLSAESTEELYEVRELMVNLAKKPKYTTPHHISAFLERSAELNKLPHALTFIYSQKGIKHVLDAEVTNTILTYLYINPNKSLTRALEKAKVAIKKTGHSDAITYLLEASIYHKNSTEIPQELREKIISSEAIELPSLNTEKGSGALASQWNDKRLTYIHLTPIAKELSEEPLIKDSVNVIAINKFIEQYKQIQIQLQKEDVFESFVSRAVLGKQEPTVEATKETQE